MNAALVKVLADAEAQVRALLSTAIGSGDYGAVAQVAEVVGWLAERRATVERTGMAAPTEVRPTESNASPIVHSPLSATPVSPRYPYFLREGDRLVKVGSSRSSDEVYEHKVGKSVLDAVVRRVLELTKKQKTFEAEDLGTIRLPGQNGTVPGYQVYLCIAWLKAIGQVKSVGRRRYGVATPERLRDEIAAAWGKLTER